MPVFLKKFFYTALVILLMTDDITPVVFCLCLTLGAEEKIAFVDKEIGGCCWELSALCCTLPSEPEPKKKLPLKKKKERKEKKLPLKKIDFQQNGAF